MATLAAQIVTDLAVLISSATMIDLSNQRDADVTEDTTRTAKVAAHAAALVKQYLGDVDGDDLVALDIGTRLALLRYSALYSLTLTATAQSMLLSIYDDLREVAEIRRVEESDPAVEDTEDYDFEGGLDRSFDPNPASGT